MKYPDTVIKAHSDKLAFMNKIIQFSMLWVFWNWQFSLILVAVVGQQAGRLFIGAASQDYDHNLNKLNLPFDVWKEEPPCPFRRRWGNGLYGQCPSENIFLGGRLPLYLSLPPHPPPPPPPPPHLGRQSWSAVSKGVLIKAVTSHFYIFFSKNVQLWKNAFFL